MIITVIIIILGVDDDDALDMFADSLDDKKDEKPGIRS